MSQAVVGALRVSLGLDSAQFTEGLSAAQKHLQGVGKGMERLGGQMDKVGQRMSLAITAPIVAFGVMSVRAATEAADAMGQVEAALTSMGGASGKTKEELVGLAEGLMRNSLYDDDEILRKVTANLLTFGNVAGTSFDRAQVAAVDLATRMGTDLQSATLMVGKALNDPIKGLTSLGRAGIQFTEAQKAQVAAMVATGNAAGAQAIILSELERQFGGAAAAAQSTDPYDKLRDSLGTLMESLGGIINTAIVPLLDYLAKLADGFSSLSPETQKFIVAGMAIAAVVGPIIVGLGAVVSAVGVLVPLFAGLVPVMAAVGGALAAVATGAIPIIVGALGLLFSPIGLIVAAVAGLTFIWIKWGDDIKRIVGRTVEAVGGWLKGKLFEVLEGVIRKVRFVSDAFFALYDAVVGNSYVPDMVEGIAHWMGKLDAGMVRPALNATDATKAAFESLRDDVAGIFESLLTDSERATRQLARDMATLDEALAKGLITRTQRDQAAGGVAAQGLETGQAIGPLGAMAMLPHEAGLRGGLRASQAAFDDAANAFADTFAQAMGRVLDGDIKGLFKDLLRDVMDNALRDLGRTLFSAMGGSAQGGGGGFWGTILGAMKIPGFKTGGSFKVGGSGGADSQLMQFRATPGEMVDIRRPGQDAGGGMVVHVNPSPYFDVQVERVAAPMAVQAAATAYGATRSDMATAQRRSRQRFV